MPEEAKTQKNKWTETEVLAFWRENKIFEKSLAKDAPRGDFTFYDGPPFATGLPHYGHIVASIIKDAVPRYRTMRGYRVPRRWGWDCHGLPIENIIEQELNLETKKDIEKFGIAKFNETARASVFRYADYWKNIIPRIGRWVDMENDYKTMDSGYTESVWWEFKTLYDKGLIYEGYKSMHICPRCETTLSNFEVAQGYKDIADISVTVKFKLDAGQKIGDFVTDDNTYILAWTTTPWTLPGNVALAINPEIEYVVVEKDSIKLIAAKARVSVLGGGHAFIKEIKGRDLIGKKYQPLFYYYAKDEKLKNRENGWKIYGADFVTTDDGTGIVHIAPAFGEDDMKIGEKYDLPFVQHVRMDGHFKDEVSDFAGFAVKPKDNPQAADIEILKWLAGKDLLFAKEKVTHSYPHCWRCDTPLLNYAASSWFVKVTAVKDRLIANNRKINWVPEHLKEGRFGKWLEGARDWAISRSRYWGAPIPIWRCAKCEHNIVIGSLDDLKKYAKKSGNRYFAMRHGQSENNAKNLVNCRLENNHYGLTELGRAQVKKSASALIGKIDIIFSSDFKRTRETAELIAEVLGIDKSSIIFDARLREVNVGIFDGQSPAEYHGYFSEPIEKFTKTPLEGENLMELKKRFTDFLYEVERKYSGKKILIVSHEYPIWMLFTGALGLSDKASIDLRQDRPDFLANGEVSELEFTPLPHDGNFVLDYHRPYIDDIELLCDKCGGSIKRVSEVFDCWFESGSMPYGQAHYPFERKEEFENNFPAEFIAEGVDQTRGWFYSMLVLSTALFGKPAFKNVVVNGIILAEDGQKMSKRLKNYPDPLEIVGKYGADALRFYLLSSSVVRGESLNFSEKGVGEIFNKVVMRLLNVLSFYEMYGAGVGVADRRASAASPAGIFGWAGRVLEIFGYGGKSILDRWILARLRQTAVEVTSAMEDYELDKAARPLADFIDDFSTWYIRRSRARFKEIFKGGENADRKEAVLTTKTVLAELARLAAPFTPFIAEKIYQTVGGGRESVHLEEWPRARAIFGKDRKIIAAMAEARSVASLGLEARAKAGIKVRQPLRSIKLKTEYASLQDYPVLLEELKDELNVKEVVFEKEQEAVVVFDTVITPELKDEGFMRDLVRETQDLRKKLGLVPQDKIAVIISAKDAVKAIIEKNKNSFLENVLALSLEFGEAPAEFTRKEIEIDGGKMIIGIRKK